MEGAVTVALSRTCQYGYLLCTVGNPGTWRTVDYLSKVTQLIMPKEPEAPYPYTTCGSNQVRNGSLFFLSRESLDGRNLSCENELESDLTNVSCNTQSVKCSEAASFRKHKA